MKKLLYALIQIIWGFPQTLVGFIVFLTTIHCPHYNFYGAVCTSWKFKSSVSLGLFIFVSDDPFYSYAHQKANYDEKYFYNMLAVHEYGHTIQSLILGPLYLPVVGLPSLIWAKTEYYQRKRAVERLSYFSVFPENQANKLGEKVTGLKSPGMIV